MKQPRLGVGACWAGLGVAVLLAAVASYADCQDPEAPDCPDQVKWSPADEISIEATTDKSSLAATVPGVEIPASYTTANLSAEASDCDSWECCGGCPGSGEGVYPDSVEIAWTVTDGPEGYQGNYDLQAEGDSATFSASLAGEYTIRATADDLGGASDCGGSQDDAAEYDTVVITVHPWETGDPPTGQLTGRTGGPGGPGMSDYGSVSVGTVVYFEVTDDDDEDHNDGGGGIDISDGTDPPLWDCYLWDDMLEEWIPCDYCWDPETEQWEPCEGGDPPGCDDCPGDDCPPGSSCQGSTECMIGLHMVTATIRDKARLADDEPDLVLEFHYYVVNE